MQRPPVWLVALALYAAGAARAGDYEIRAIALRDAPAPGGGTFQSGFRSPRVGPGPEVAFFANLSGGAEGLFVWEAGGLHAVARSGDSAPGSGGGSFSAFGPHDLGSDGSVVFVSDLQGGSAARGLFRDQGGTLSALVLAGDTAPGTGGAQFTDFLTAAAGEAGRVLFTASVSLVPPLEGVFLWAGGGAQKLALSGEPAPGGGTFSTDFSPSMLACDIGGGSDAFFVAPLTGATSPGGLFQHDGSGLSALVLVGDPAPGGGTHSPLFTCRASSAGVTYPGQTGGGEAAIFVASAGGGRRVALVGDPAPDTGGRVFSSLIHERNFSQPAINAGGTVAFWAQVDDTGPPDPSYDEGIFSASASIRLVALSSEPAPGGGSFGALAGDPDVGDRGEVAFRSEGRGLFLASPTTPVAAASLRGRALLLALVAALGALALRRGRG